MMKSSIPMAIVGAGLLFLNFSLHASDTVNGGQGNKMRRAAAEDGSNIDHGTRNCLSALQKKSEEQKAAMQVAWSLPAADRGKEKRYLTHANALGISTFGLVGEAGKITAMWSLVKDRILIDDFKSTYSCPLPAVAEGGRVQNVKFELKDGSSIFLQNRLAPDDRSKNTHGMVLYPSLGFAGLDPQAVKNQEDFKRLSDCVNIDEQIQSPKEIDSMASSSDSPLGSQDSGRLTERDRLKMGVTYLFRHHLLGLSKTDKEKLSEVCANAVDTNLVGKNALRSGPPLGMLGYSSYYYGMAGAKPFERSPYGMPSSHPFFRSSGAKGYNTPIPLVSPFEPEGGSGSLNELSN